MSRHAPSYLAVVFVALQLSPVRSGDLLPGSYRLREESSAAVGCLDLCDCPIQKVPGFDGTFDVFFNEAGATFTRYLVENIEWSVDTEEPLAVRGSGFIEIRIDGTEERQLFEAWLTVDDAPPQLFRHEALRTGKPGEIAADVRPAELVCFGQIFQVRASRVGSTRFVRGDCDARDSINISDAITLLLRLFSGTEPPLCAAACDANDDAVLDISDVVFTLRFLFLGGALPPAPFPDCGESGGALACSAFPACA